MSAPQIRKYKFNFLHIKSRSLTIKIQPSSLACDRHRLMHTFYNNFNIERCIGLSSTNDIEIRNQMTSNNLISSRNKTNFALVETQGMLFCSFEGHF